MFDQVKLEAAAKAAYVAMASRWNDRGNGPSYPIDWAGETQEMREDWRHAIAVGLSAYADETGRPQGVVGG